MALGYIYVLSNPSMAGLIKIGYTTGTVERRARELSVSTGVPVSFVIEYFHLSEDVEEIEALVHAELGASRVSDNREFFKTRVEEAIAAVQRFVRPPPVTFVRTESLQACRRCGFRYPRTPSQQLCPKCGF